jgi:hypothetical protein
VHTEQGGDGNDNFSDAMTNVRVRNSFMTRQQAYTTTLDTGPGHDDSGPHSEQIPHPANKR